MEIKVNARETELKIGKEATYHSAMIWKMKQIRCFLRHKKVTQIPWITQIWSLCAALRRFYCCARNPSKSIKNLGAKPRNKRAILGSKKSGSSVQSVWDYNNIAPAHLSTLNYQLSTINCQLSPSSPPPGSNLWKNIINEKLMFQLMVINVE